MKLLSEGPFAGESGSRWWDDCVGQVLYALATRVGPVVDVIDVVSRRYKVRDLVMEIEGTSPGLSPAVIRAALEELGDQGLVSFPFGALGEPMAEVWLLDRGLAAARMVWPDVGRVLKRITLVTKHRQPMLNVRLETGLVDLDKALNEAPMRVFVALLVLAEEPNADSPFVPSEIRERVQQLLLHSTRQRPGRTRGEIVTEEGVADALKWLERPLGVVQEASPTDGRRVHYRLRGAVPEVRVHAGDPHHLRDWMNFRIVVRRISNKLTVKGYADSEKMLFPPKKTRVAKKRGAGARSKRGRSRAI